MKPKPKQSRKPRPQHQPKPKNTWQRVAKEMGSLALSTARKVVPPPYNLLLGGGMYDITQNSLTDAVRPSENGLRVQVPSMHSTNESVVLRHSEYLFDLSSSSLFTTTSVSINPGIEGSFPWLSSIATNFTEYKFRGLAYEYRTTSVDALNSINTALGYVVMAPVYNPDYPTPTSKIALEAQMGAASGKPSNDILCLVECATNNPTKTLYVRDGIAVPSTPLMYDLGQLVIATGGQQNANVIGEVWVTYEIELFKPNFSSGALLSNANYARYTSTSATNAAPLGTSRSKAYDNFFGVPTPGLAISNTVIIIPSGNIGTYVLQLHWYGAPVTWVPPVVTYSSGLSGVRTYTNGTSDLMISPFSGALVTTTTQLTVCFAITNPSVNNTLTIGTAGTIPTGNLDILLVQIDGNAV